MDTYGSKAEGWHSIRQLWIGTPQLIASCRLDDNVRRSFGSASEHILQFTSRDCFCRFLYRRPFYLLCVNQGLCPALSCFLACDC